VKGNGRLDSSTDERLRQETIGRLQWTVKRALQVTYKPKDACKSMPNPVNKILT